MALPGPHPLLMRRRCPRLQQLVSSLTELVGRPVAPGVRFGTASRAADLEELLALEAALPVAAVWFHLFRFLSVGSRGQGIDRHRLVRSPDFKKPGPDKRHRVGVVLAGVGWQQATASRAALVSTASRSPVELGAGQRQGGAREDPVISAGDTPGESGRAVPAAWSRAIVGSRSFREHDKAPLLRVGVSGLERVGRGWGTGGPDAQM